MVVKLAIEKRFLLNKSVKRAGRLSHVTYVNDMQVFESCVQSEAALVKRSK